MSTVQSGENEIVPMKFNGPDILEGDSALCKDCISPLNTLDAELCTCAHYF
jgi:hypothetical protein